jgi:hypothetical protein
MASTQNLDQVAYDKELLLNSLFSYISNFVNPIVSSDKQLAEYQDGTISLKNLITSLDTLATDH